jgi:hypothetical protein
MADFHPAQHVDEQVTFSGTARTAMAGAIVAVGAGQPVYVAGLERWEPELEGQTVEVSGTLRMLGGEEEPAEDDELVHEVDPERFVLEDWSTASASP